MEGDVEALEVGGTPGGAGPAGPPGRPARSTCRNTTPADRLEHHGAQQHAEHLQQGAGAATGQQRRHAGVDADLHQPRHGQPGGVLQQRPRRVSSRTSRRYGASRSPSSRRLRLFRRRPTAVGDVVGVLGGDTAPGPPRHRLAGSGSSSARARGAAGRWSSGALIGRPPPSRRRRPAARGRPAPRQQLGVGADVGDGAVLQQGDAVGQQHRGGPVGHDDAGDVGQHPAQGLLDQRLGVDVQRGQRVVEHQHGRPRQHRPGQRQALALAAGQAHALLADPGVQAPRQVVHEAGLRHVERLGDLLRRRVGAAEGEVLAHRHGEQRRVLERRRDDRAQRVQGQAADVVPVDGDRRRP